MSRTRRGASPSTAPRPGSLDRRLLHSAAQWLDTGPALAAQRVTTQAVAPALAAALVLVTLLLRSTAELVRAGLVAAGVAVQAVPGVPALAWQVAAFVVVAAAVLPPRPRHGSAALVAAGAVATALALAAVVGWAQGYLDGRGTIWPAMMSRASVTPDLYALCQLVLLPLLAVVVVALRRDRTALALLAAHAGLAVLGDTRPPLAALHAVLTYAVVVVAWGGRPLPYAGAGHPPDG